MEKLINYIGKEKILIIVAVIISLFPLFIPGFLYTHDGIIHLYRTSGAYNNIINFDFNNRVYYNMISGFGYGWGIFYPPLSAIIPAVFMILGFSLFTAEKLFLITASIFAGLFAFKLFREITNNRFCSLLATLLYVLAPYKINQIIVRGAMGEVLLFTFLPLIILGLIKIINKKYNCNYYFVLGTCGVVYSHVISSVYIAIFAILFLLLNIKSVFNKRTILELLKCAIIIILICLPIIVPLAEHQFMNIYKVNSMTSGDVKNNVVHPGQLIGSSIEGKEVENTAYFSNEKEMNYMIGLTSIIILMLLPFVYKKIKQNGDKNGMFQFIILAIITILMMITPNIWNKISILDVIQFPWRILTFTTLFISIIACYILKAIITEENKYSFLIFILGYSFIFVFLIGIKANFAKTLNEQFDFNNQQLTQNDDYGSIAFSLGYSHEYLPRQLNAEKLKSRSKDILVLEGDVQVEDLSIDQDTLDATIISNMQNSVIELPYIYYKGYTVNINNTEVSYAMSDDGFIKVNIPDSGDYKINVEYSGTVLYKTIDLITIITMGIFIANIFKDKKLIKKLTS